MLLDQNQLWVIQVLTKILKHNNFFIFSLTLLYSCSTNTPSVSYIHFNSGVNLKEVVINEKRFNLTAEVKDQYKAARRAETFFNYIVSNPDVIKRNTFDYCVENKDIILTKIKHTESIIVTTVDKYYPLWRFSSVLAYQNRNGIFLNGYKMNRSECDFVETLVHEYLHRLGYGHGDNSSSGKQSSVPYYFGGVARSECEKGNI